MNRLPAIRKGGSPPPGRTFWPELVPAPKRPRYTYCASCRRNGGPTHASTAGHRAASRPSVYTRGSGDWLSRRPAVMVDPYGDRRDWDAEEAEAIARGDYDPKEGFTHAR